MLSILPPPIAHSDHSVSSHLRKSQQLHNPSAKALLFQSSTSFVPDVDWDSLPDEIVTLIFSQLPPNEINTVRMVSRRWYTLSYDSGTVGRRMNVNISFIGPSVGKSILIGRLYSQLGMVDSHTLTQLEKHHGRASMWHTFSDTIKTEIETGHTVELHRFFVKSSGTCSTRHTITMIDTPSRYLKATLCAISQADYAVLVVFPEHEWIQTHMQYIADLVSACKVFRHKKLVVAMNMITPDCINNPSDCPAKFNHIRDDLIYRFKTYGFLSDDIIFVPINTVYGVNITTGCHESVLPFLHDKHQEISKEFRSWWTGPSLFDAISDLQVPNRHLNRPLRISIDKSVKVTGVGTVIIGTVIQGTVNAGQLVKIGPVGHVTKVRSLHLAVSRTQIHRGLPGDYVALNIPMSKRECGARRNGLVIGFLKDPSQVEKVINSSDEIRRLRRLSEKELFAEGEIRQKDGPMYPVSSFVAQLSMWNPQGCIREGYQPILHSHNVMSPVIIKEIISYTSSSPNRVSNTIVSYNGTEIKELKKGDVALVRITAMGRPLSVDTEERCAKLGRFCLREAGAIIGAGIIVSAEYSSQYK